MTERRIFTMANQVASALVSIQIYGIFIGSFLMLEGSLLIFIGTAHAHLVNLDFAVMLPDQAFLHSKDLLHGNIRARSVLISKMFTAKLWGLHGVYTRKNQGATQREDSSMKKWQAPEVLAKRPASEKSDV